MTTQNTGRVYDINTASELTILETPDMLATFNIKKAALWKRVKTQKLPPPIDNGGANGRARWTIGQIRSWTSALAEIKTQHQKERMQKLINENLSLKYNHSLDFL